MHAADQKQVRSQLKKFRQRILLRFLAEGLSIASFWGIGCGFLLILLSFVFPIEGVWAWGIFTWGMVMLLALGLLWIRRPRKEKLAQSIDSFGMKERLQTMYALREKSDDFAQLQRAETLSTLQYLDPKIMIPIPIPSRRILISGLCMLLCGAVCLLPSPQDEILNRRKEIRTAMVTQAEKLRQVQEELRQNDDLTAEEKTALNEKLEELAQALREGKDYKESIKKMSELQDHTADLRREKAKEKLRQMKEQFSNSDQSALNRLSEKLDENNPQSLEDALKQEMEKQDPDSLEELAQALKDAAEKEEDPKVQALLEKIAQALEDQDSADLSDALSSLRDDSVSPGLSDLGDQLKLSKNQISKLSADPQKGRTGNSPNGSPQEGDSSGTDDNPGDKPGKGSGDGGKGNEGNGSGNGPGNNGPGNNGPGSGNGSGAGFGSGELVDAEKIYDGNRLDLEKNQIDLEGQMNENGEHQQGETEAGDGSLDGYISYKDVVGNYGNEAVSAAKRAQLPPTEQDWVEAYFSALQE